MPVEGRPGTCSFLIMGESIHFYLFVLFVPTDNIMKMGKSSLTESLFLLLMSKTDLLPEHREAILTRYIANNIYTNFVFLSFLTFISFTIFPFVCICDSNNKV